MSSVTPQRTRLLDPARVPSKWRLPLVATLVVVVAALLVFQYSGLRAARSAGLLPTPQRFTALSFKDPAGLPKTAGPHSSLQLDFVIGNHEGRRTAYRWFVTISTSRRRVQVASGRTTVDRSSSSVVLLVVSPPPGIHGPATIAVHLASPHETITAHLARS